jgi:hypothetical protein
MPIISTYPKWGRRKAEKAFLGVVIPKNISDYLTLYSHAFGSSKSNIITVILTAWLEDKKIKFDAAFLEEEIAAKALRVWEKKEGMSFATFTATLKYELKKRKIDVEVVGRILKKLEDAKGKKE